MKLEDYKEYIISYYRKAADIDTYDKRKEHINAMYRDEKLEEILEQTRRYISILLKEIKKKMIVFGSSFYFEKELQYQYYKYISNNSLGGWFSDIVFTDEGLEVSKWILEETFQRLLNFDLTEKEYEEYNEEECTGITWIRQFLTVKGNILDFERFYNDFVVNGYVYF